MFFKIYLPLLIEEEGACPKEQQSVLIIDKDKLQTIGIQNLTQSLGYQSICLPSFPKALIHYSESWKKIPLIIG